jgi:multidrug efflux pump
VTGAGAEARNSIGLVLVGGMAVGTFFTLFVIPSIYMLIAKNKVTDEAAAKPQVQTLPATPIAGHPT